MTSPNFPTNLIMKIPVYIQSNYTKRIALKANTDHASFAAIEKGRKEDGLSCFV